MLCQKVWWKPAPRASIPYWLLLPVPLKWTAISGTSSAAKPNGIIAELGVRAGDHLLQERRWAYPLVCCRSAGCNGISKDAAPEPKRQTYFAGDAFSDDWIRQIRINAPDAPVLVTAGGLLHYFEEEKVLAFCGCYKASEIWRSCLTA